MTGTLSLLYLVYCKFLERERKRMVTLPSVRGEAEKGPRKKEKCIKRKKENEEEKTEVKKGRFIQIFSKGEKKGERGG
jgi:hypothetical protein